MPGHDLNPDGTDTDTSRHIDAGARAVMGVTSYGTAKFIPGTDLKNALDSWAEILPRICSYFHKVVGHGALPEISVNSSVNISPIMREFHNLHLPSYLASFIFSLYSSL